MLRKITDGLGWGGAYNTTIERIKAPDGGKSRLGMAALMWVSHAERPLKEDDLCHALAVELHSKDFNARNVPSISTLMSCCQGLITVDKETSTVRLIHPTVKEYLSARPGVLSRPHAAMAEICLTYLNSEPVKSLSANPSAATHDKPFLSYCSVYWGVHAKKQLSSHARSLALELFREYYGHISSKLLLKQVEREVCLGFIAELETDDGGDDGSSFSELHCASFLGITDIVAVLIEMESYDINERDTRGSTPLAWAARNGHEDVVKMLLRRREVHPGQSNYSGLTPLSYAAWKGHEGVVKMLLEQRDVNPDEPDDSEQTPLSYAAHAGHEGVVKILLELAAVNPDESGESGETPLSFAAMAGHERVAKILLGRGEVNPDKPDNDGRTPLSHAAECGQAGMVKILLGRGEVSPDKPDNDGQTPFSYAAASGHAGILKILRGRGEVDPDKPDNDGRTPFSYASMDMKE